ncbi:MULTISPECIES: ABC transporter substrate-binding protein [Lactococcus]|uniref:Fe-bacillibactin uptake system FeuA Fe-bacillibactin binding n=1 Tax=Lactococcus lactis subsp. cremoris TaxID=1359 RepID=A0A170MYQ0_LACLC|nr:ABC transporter substrate-binding protein [Lactococcus cremoris]KZK07347.1 Fe-bacillibactin uptake system FeuA Fe-bacillibactin binding [Lactococcus cremoris]
MKKFFLVISILLPTLFLSGCSPTRNSTSESENPSQSKPINKSNIEYLNKTYKVKFPTSKIITASFESMEDAVALNIHPIGGVTVSGEMPSYLKNKLGNNIINIGDKFGPNVESVASLKPDIILGSTKFDDSVTNNLRKIAPTINVSHKSNDWDKNLLLMGTLSGHIEKAKNLISSYENDVKFFKKDNPQINDKKIMIIRIREGELCLYGEDFYYNPMLYKDLSFSMPKELSTVKGQTTISKEQLSKIESDIILIQFMTSENKAFPNALNDLKNDTIWKNIPAVANHKVFYNVVDGGYQGGTYLSKEVMLRALNEKVFK